MKQIILVLAMLVVWAFPMEADDASGEVRGVISDQFAAFLADDVDTAFSYASPGIRQVFVTPEGFGQMVQTGYPMVWRPAETRFLELRLIDGAPWQKVLVRDGAGSWHVLDYKMLRVDGAWRIDAVQYLRHADTGV